MDGSLRYRQLQQQWANNRRLRRIRSLKDRLNPLEEFDEENFRRRFRLRKDSVIILTDILKDDLQHQTRRGLPLTPVQQVLATLRVYATASFQQVIGDLFGISNYAVCKVIHRVSREIAKKEGNSFLFQPIYMKRRKTRKKRRKEKTFSSSPNWQFAILNSIHRLVFRFQ